MPYVIALVAIIAIGGTAMSVADNLGANFHSIDTILQEFSQ